MLSKIKIDVDLNNTPVIEIDYFENPEDLRDKMLGKFLNIMHHPGRLAFIDRDGGKLNRSESSSCSFRYTIKAIDPDHYEFLLEEIQRLIEERDSNRSLEYVCKKKEERNKITENEKKVILNY